MTTTKTTNTSHRTIPLSVSWSSPTCCDPQQYHHHVIIIITSCQNQEKMRDLAEKLFNTRCGVMVEKVNNRYYHCYYYWWLRRWEIIANIMSWREHKNIWITTIYTVNLNPRMTSLTWSWSQYLEAPPFSQNLFLSDSTTSTWGEQNIHDFFFL